MPFWGWLAQEPWWSQAIMVLFAALWAFLPLMVLGLELEVREIAKKLGAIDRATDDEYPGPPPSMMRMLEQLNQHAIAMRISLEKIEKSLADR